MFLIVSIFISSFIIALSGAMMPGPLLSITIAESSQKGIRAGPLLIIGHGILEMVLVIGLLVGFARVLNKDWVIIFIFFAGGVFLMGFGISMLKSLASLTLNIQPSNQSTDRVIWKGAVISFLNPDWLIWWTTIGLGYIVQLKELGYWTVGVFYTGHIAADFVWYTLISIGISKGKRFFSDTLYRRIAGFCAALLIAFSIYFFIAAILNIRVKYGFI